MLTLLILLALLTMLKKCLHRGIRASVYIAIWLERSGIVGLWLYGPWIKETEEWVKWTDGIHWTIALHCLPLLLLEHLHKSKLKVSCPQNMS